MSETMREDMVEALRDALVYADVEPSKVNLQILYEYIPNSLFADATEWGWRDTEVFAQLYRITENLFHE